MDGWKLEDCFPFEFRPIFREGRSMLYEELEQSSNRWGTPAEDPTPTQAPAKLAGQNDGSARITTLFVGNLETILPSVRPQKLNLDPFKTSQLCEAFSPFPSAWLRHATGTWPPAGRIMMASCQVPIYSTPPSTGHQNVWILLSQNFRPCNGKIPPTPPGPMVTDPTSSIPNLKRKDIGRFAPGFRVTSFWNHSSHSSDLVANIARHSNLWLGIQRLIDLIDAPELHPRFVSLWYPMMQDFVHQPYYVHILKGYQMIGVCDQWSVGKNQRIIPANQSSSPTIQ